MQFAYLYWKIDVIIADHDGYCSGAENDEEIYSDVICCSYAIKADEYEQLKALSIESPNNLYRIFNSESAFNHNIQPHIENDNEDIAGGGSGYCRASEHGLYHERKRIPIEVVDFSFTRPGAPGPDDHHMIDILHHFYEILEGDFIAFAMFLQNVREINQSIAKSLQIHCVPSDIIKLVCRYVWNNV